MRSFHRIDIYGETVVAEVQEVGVEVASYTVESSKFGRWFESRSCSTLHRT